MTGQADLALIIYLRKVVAIVLLEGCEGRLLSLELVILLRNTECFVV